MRLKLGHGGQGAGRDLWGAPREVSPAPSRQAYLMMGLQVGGCDDRRSCQRNVHPDVAVREDVGCGEGKVKLEP
jgi:hypothetical protein